MIREDDRTPEQEKTHTILVAGTDRCLSGWGQANGGSSVAAWACTSEDHANVEAWVDSRGDMKRVRTVIDRSGDRYRPRNAAHLHIYVVTKGHPALA